MSKSVPGAGSGDKLLSYCVTSLFFAATLFFSGSVEGVDFFPSSIFLDTFLSYC